MEADISDSSLPVFKALASPVRIHIIQKLSRRKMSVSELATDLNLSSTIILLHPPACIFSFSNIAHPRTPSGGPPPFTTPGA